MAPTEPTLEVEGRELAHSPIIVALDEVGRGAIAGPVTIGAAVIGPDQLSSGIPEGLRDSKLVSATRRPEVAERASAWCLGVELGWSTAGEVDELGIMTALGLAADRALSALIRRGFACDDAVVLLDGNHDYVTAQATSPVRVRTIVKGDRDCASLAAASVHAKVARDQLMVDLDTEYPAYGWAQNKGYGSAAHRLAIASIGLSPHHRASWAIGVPRPERAPTVAADQAP